MGDCYWEDEGQYWADVDFDMSYEEDKFYADLYFPTLDDYRECRERVLEQMIKQRLVNQKGKYLISANKNGKILYLQDRRISTGGYWTQFKANARVFTDKRVAEKLANSFKYNNPKVIRG